MSTTKEKSSAEELNLGTVVSMCENAWHCQQSNHYITRAVYDSLRVGPCKEIYIRGHVWQSQIGRKNFF